MSLILDNKTRAYRVLVVCNDGEYFLRHRLPLVDHLTSIGTAVTVLVGGNLIPADYIRGWEYAHVQIERFGFDLIKDTALTVRTAQIVSRLKPDAVHLITLKPTVFSGFASLISRLFVGHPKRILITLPGLGRMMSKPIRSDERNYALGRALTSAALRLMAMFGCVHFSFETRHDYDYWADRNVTTKENSSIIDGVGVDPELFYPTEGSPNRKSKLKVLFASRLLESKGLNAFLLMASGMSNRGDVEFIVAGMADDQDPDAVRPEYLKQLAQISFLGHVENMPDLLRACDVVCLPTRYGEGLPRILIEAAASGLASIVSDHPGCREIVDDGVTGQILMNGTDLEMSRQMSAAVLNYLEFPDLLARHKRAAYRRFQSREFNQKIVIDRYMELLGVGIEHIAISEGIKAGSSPGSFG
jgi:glycosyltransferase involved in cell wall biosynthesis